MIPVLKIAKTDDTSGRSPRIGGRLRLTVALLALATAAPVPSAAQAPGGSFGNPQPGDVIRISVWREPELSGEFTIDESGEVVLPQIGPMVVSTESPSSLKAKIVEAFGRYLTHSSIDVELLRRIQVLGAVRNPGLYSVDGTMSVSDAIAMAGGATTEGQLKRVELVRGGRRLEGRLSMDARLASTPIQSGDQLFVPERGWLVRNSAIVAAALTGSISLVIALLTR